MHNRIRWIIYSLSITLIVFLTYNGASHFLEKHFNLLLRDWIWVLAIIISISCILIIEIATFTKLRNILEERIHIHNIWKLIIKTISMALILSANFYAFLMCLIMIGMGFQESGVETYKGEKYLVIDTGWTTPQYFYNYHPYKNLFVYYKDIKYSGEVKWEDYVEPKIGDRKDPNSLQITVEEDIDNTIVDKVEYIQNIDGNLNYGFYLIDRASHQYLYAFVKSYDNGLSWEIVYQFPSNSDIYYVHFLDEELGFINFGSSDGLSLFMTNDGGLTWKDILINLPEENRNMLSVQGIKNNDEEIELILGVPSWSNSNQTIKYISVDKGLSWDLQSID